MSGHSTVGASQLYYNAVRSLALARVCISYTVPPVATLHLEAANPWLALPAVHVSTVSPSFIRELLHRMLVLVTSVTGLLLVGSLAQVPWCKTVSQHAPPRA